MTEDFTADASDIDISSLWEDDKEVPKKPDPLRGNPLTADALRGDDETVIMNPMTGELIDTEDIDALIGAAVEVKSMMAELKFFGDTLRKTALKKTAGDKKTRRLRGKTKEAKLENCGSVYPVGSILKEAYLSYPQFRDQYLRIDGIALKKTEFNKLAQMSTDDKAFQSFTDMLKRAVETGNPALPSITLEHDSKKE